MFKKILIANRGEIAVRVIRACREMGIGAVAIYSDADRKALHVRCADEAYHIGPAPSRDSYLHIERIIEAARRAGVEAIHPGYGFLSENPEFARACEQAGIVFVGPPAAAMELMGSKTAARQAAVRAGLPVVPGTEGNLENLEEVRQITGETGFPVMLKASAGGGGKGMRLVRTADELEAAYRNARSEALNAFNDASIYLEKYIERPRHVEIQILGDLHGNLIYLGERECSLQRRHQKVLEECPSPILDEALRRRMGESAVRLAKVAGYSSAGTVEFLVDHGRHFYFLEVNARLQVEHPVTELVVGIDLVKEQIRIASGEPLRLRQEEVHLRGAAIECRICAEDPRNAFFPSPGLITRMKVPAGPGVRDDGGVYEGWNVPLEYDSLLSKLVVWGADRAEAIGRMRRALADCEISGIQTNIAFFRRILAHPDFVAGRFDTGFVDRALDDGLLSEGEPNRDAERVAMLAAALEFSRSRLVTFQGARPAAGHARENGWKMAGRDALLNRWPGRSRG